MLCILYFITVPGVYKLNKTLHAAACVPVRDEQKGPGCCMLTVTQSSRCRNASGRTLHAFVTADVFVISFHMGIFSL